MEKELVSINEVEHIAQLSRLNFSEEEKKSMQQSLSEIVDYFSSIKTVDTNGVDAINKPASTAREDVIKPSLPKTEVVKNAPVHNANSFVVPRGVE